MSFSTGDRVVLLKSHAGVPKGSLGTVVSGGPVTSLVDFDVNPSNSVVTPNSLLAPAFANAKAAQQSTLSYPRGTKGAGGQTLELLWFPPTVGTPGVATAANFVAVTATPDILSLLVQGGEVALRRAQTSGCWIGTLDFPVTGGPANLSVDLRGFLAQRRGAKTTIFVVIGAVFQSFAFDDEQDGNFLKTFAATIGDEPIQTITIILLAERRADTDDVLFVIDSLDIART